MSGWSGSIEVRQNQWVFCTGLLRVAVCCYMDFMSRKDISWVKCSKVNLIVGWRLFMKSFMDWNCLVVPM